MKKKNILKHKLSKILILISGGMFCRLRPKDYLRSTYEIWLSSSKRAYVKSKNYKQMIQSNMKANFNKKYIVL